MPILGTSGTVSSGKFGAGYLDGATLITKLVQISDMKFPKHAETRYNYGAHERLTPVVVANMSRHRLIVKLVDELSTMFGRIGMHQTCARCFKGQLNAQEARLKGYKGNGCCDSCSMLGHSSCLNKPITCATWMCHNLTMRLWPLTAKFMEEMRTRLVAAKLYSGAYSTGILWEHDIKPNLVQRRLLRTLIREVRAHNEARAKLEAA